MDQFIIIQIIGFIAMAIGTLAQQAKTSRRMIGFSIPSSALWTIQYIMLGAPIGALINGGGILKDIGVLAFNKRHVPLLIATYIIFSCVIGLYMFKAWYDILPLICVTVLNLSFIQRDNRPLIARAMIINCLLWIVYNGIVESWMGLACACFVICSSIIGMYRHENWDIGKCYKSFFPSLARSLFIFPKWGNA